MPSHNCINKLQCSVFKVHLWASFSRDSMKQLNRLNCFSQSLNFAFCILHFAFRRSGGPKWTRFSAEKPRRLKQSTGLFPRAGFRVPYRTLSSNPSASIQALWEVVGQNGLEPSTSRLSVVCSSQLSYWPILVEISGIEPLTSCLQGRRSPSWAKPPYPSPCCLGTLFVCTL